MIQNYAQWILWQRVPRDDGRVDKVPTGTDLRNINAHDRTHWMSYDAAKTLAEKHGEPYGVGFVFTRDDPFYFIDIDDCALPDGSGWQPIVGELCGLLPGAMVEVSQSGRGIHIIGVGTAPPHPAERRIKAGTLFDLFTDGRFMALGRGFPEPWTIAGDQTTGIAAICGKYLKPDPPTVGGTTEWTSAPVESWRGPDDDDALIARALSAKSAASMFGGGVSFAQLWRADTDALGNKWPDPHGVREYNASAADMALAQHLAFWTGNDCERIRRLMLRSGLARDKWESRPGWLDDTILSAVRRQDTAYQARDVPVGTVETDADDSARAGYQLLTVQQQREYFAGCVYIRKLHRAFVPGGDLCRPEQFKTWYGGYNFQLDLLNDKTTKNAWEAFTESQGYSFPKVTALRFRPLEPPGEIGTAADGTTYINAYVPKWGARSNDDPGPFLKHMSKLLPDEKDREIVLSYLAACVQLAGKKFQWCLVLQGTQGNGKTLLWRILEHAIGADYCHQASPKDLDSPFNAWVEHKLLAGIEEVRVGGKRDLNDVIKPLITNSRIALQPKGVDQYTGDNCANFLLFSNHKDAVHKSINDRRYCVIYTAQQEALDLQRDGMTEAYFSALFDWLHDAGGLAAVAGYLASRPVNVSIFGRAPVTSSTAEAVRQSLGVAEQLIVEAVENEVPGFCNNMLDPVTVREYLGANGRKMSPEATVRVLQRLDFIPHPALQPHQGRMSINGVRRHIYVKRGTLAANLTTTDAVRAAYGKKSA